MAARFLVTGGSGNWTNTNNWSATSGGASGASFPVNGDAVTFDAASGATNLTIDTGAQACTSLSITSGYTGTLTRTFGLTVAGAVTLGANMTLAGSGGLTLNTSATITSNGKAWNAPISNSLVTTAITLADPWTVTDYNSTNTTGAQNLNGSTLNITGNLTLSATTGILQGTTQLVMTGTGNITMASVTSGRLTSPLEINTAGTVTLTGTTFRYNGTLKRTSGTFSTNGVPVAIVGANTITNNGATFNFDSLTFTTGAQTWNGTAGFTMGTFTTTTGAFTLTSGNTYGISTSAIAIATSASHVSFLASTPSSSAFLNISGSTIAFAYVDATDIDSSGGNAIYTYSGTLLRTANWTTGTTINGPSTSGGGGADMIFLGLGHQ